MIYFNGNITYDKRMEKRPMERVATQTTNIQNIKSRNRCIDLIVANNNSPKVNNNNKIENVTKRIFSFGITWRQCGGTNQKICIQKKNEHTDTPIQKTYAVAFANMSGTLTNKISKSLTFAAFVTSIHSLLIQCNCFFLFVTNT